MNRTLVAACVGGLALLPLRAAAAEPDAKGVEFFEKKIRPVLVQHCYQCHSQEAAGKNKLKGGLLLDTRDGVRAGGDTGPAVVPGKPRDSLLLNALRHDTLKMPPRSKLPDAVLADFVQWVQMGAPDPRGGTAAVGRDIDIEAGRKHWAFQPVKKVEPPAVKDAAWARTAVDRFVLAKLEEKGIAAPRPADRLGLLRRAHFDLTGLPPSPEDVDAFLKDSSADAFAKVVDKLLDSPHFGERWGRRWLDLARYAESNGNADNVPFPHAWRYRDYVIGSFNKDKPYNQFLTEQLAGDLLAADDPTVKNEYLTATGFLTLASKPRAQNNPNYQMDLVADQVETMSSAVMGLTVACARCHDHKFDPIPTKEYYSLAGIFTSSAMLHGSGGRGAGGNKKNAGAGGLHALMGADGKPGDDQAMGLRDGAKAADCQVCVRGELTSRGPSVPRGFITVATIGTPPKIPTGQSGRAELAKWLTDANHPLTARVMANRVWLHLFGQGLVRTPDNFGTLGDRPSHPELLDWLAGRFVGNGWSVKKLVRELMLSHAYQATSDPDPDSLAKDPTNRLFWRAGLRRLDAESLRDGVLAASGRLDPTPPAGSTATFGGNKKSPAAQRDNVYRSVYLPTVRSGIPEVLGVFDFVDTSLVVGDREVTTVPTQSLYLLNSPFVVEQSRQMADRVLAAGPDDAARIALAYKLAVGRPPSAGERDRVTEYLARTVDELKATEKDEAKRRSAAWASFCQALLASAEFRYLQ